MLTVRDTIPKARELATAEFATPHLRLLKIAARVVETTSRVRRGMSRSRPDPRLARRAAAPRPLTDGAAAPFAQPIPQARCKYGSSGGEKPNAVLCASSEEMCVNINRVKKPHSHE